MMLSKVKRVMICVSLGGLGSVLGGVGSEMVRLCPCVLDRAPCRSLDKVSVRLPAPVMSSTWLERGLRQLTLLPDRACLCEFAQGDLSTVWSLHPRPGVFSPKRTSLGAVAETRISRDSAIKLV